jgi:hypothetical protein
MQQVWQKQENCGKDQPLKTNVNINEYAIQPYTPNVTIIFSFQDKIFIFSDAFLVWFYKLMFSLLPEERS